MNTRRIIAAIAGGLLAFLVVGVATTEVLSDVIWPSLFVGIPVGFIAGLVVGIGIWSVLRP